MRALISLIESSRFGGYNAGSELGKFRIPGYLEPEMQKATSLIVTLSLVTLVTPAPAQDKPPTIAFESLTKDFGKVIEGQNLKHLFKFKNNGQGLLEILKVEPS
jgi:hypothetical protein